MVLAASGGFPVSERTLTRDDRLCAGKVFPCGSGAGLAAVASLDDTPPGHDARPCLATLHAAPPAYARRHGTAF